MRSLTAPAIAAQILLLSIQAALYFGVQIFEGHVHDVYRKADDKIPFIPSMVFIYVQWFPLIALFPLMLLYYSYSGYLWHMIALSLDILLSCTVYLLYPTSFARPNPGHSRSGRIMRFVYRADFKGKNCMPSMHCSMCFLMILSCAARTSHMPVPIEIGVIILCCLIVASTVLTKQHVILDVVSGIGMAVLCRLIAGLVVRFGLTS